MHDEPISSHKTLPYFVESASIPSGDPDQAALRFGRIAYRDAGQAASTNVANDDEICLYFVRCFRDNINSVTLANTCMRALDVEDPRNIRWMHKHVGTGIGTDRMQLYICPGATNAFAEYHYCVVERPVILIYRIEIDCNENLL